MPTSPDALRALRHPFVRAFAVGRFAAVAGYQIISVTVGWQLYERTGQAWALGLVGLIEIAPVLLLTVVSGNVADRYPRRAIGMAAHALLSTAALGLAMVSWLHAPTPLIYGLLALVGLGRSFAGPSVSTILPQLLSPIEFASANAWLASVFQLAAIAGPAVGGLMIAVTGSGTLAFLLAACLQAIFVLMLRTLPSVAPAPTSARARSATEVFAGFTFVRRNPLFLAAITVDLFAVLFGGAVALLPIFAKDILQAGPAGLGLLRAAPAVGAMLMALVTTRMAPWQRPGRALLYAVCGFGLATVGFGLSRHIGLSLACLFFTGVFDNISVVIRITLEQMITPDALRGRVAAVNQIFIGMSNELGAFESGATAALLGPIVSVVGGGMASIVVVALVLWRWPELSRIGPLHSLRPSIE